MKRNKKGFTLAELLIVVAIIAVLVAISIPVFTAQLEKSREAVDQANIRSAYAEVSAAGLTKDTANYSKTFDLKQQEDGWSVAPEFPANTTSTGTPKKGKTVTVQYNETTNNVDITYAS